VSYLDLWIEYHYRTNNAESENTQEFTGEISKSEVLHVYAAILDKIVIETFNDIIEDETLCEHFKKLNRSERNAILFDATLGFTAMSTAIITGSTADRVYAQKCKAIKRLKKELGIVD
jgi:hypothetical protein